MPRRRITKALIQFISLVPKGANTCPVLYKADDGKPDEGTFTLDTIIKASDGFREDGELTAVVMAPEITDSQGDIASGAVIKDAMYSFSQRRGQIDIRHDGKAVDPSRAFVAESFIIQKEDPRFKDFKDYSGRPLDVTGAWATVIKIEDPELRKAYSSGEWNGVSVGGYGAAETLTKGEDADSLATKIIKAICNLLPFEKEHTMTPEQLATLTKSVTDGNAATIEALARLTAALTPEKANAPVFVEKADAPPGFVGDRFNPVDISRHVLKCSMHSLQKGVDWGDADSVASYHVALVKFQTENGIDDVTITSLGGPPPTASRSATASVLAGFSKGMASDTGHEGLEGLSFADEINKSRGYASVKTASR